MQAKPRMDKSITQPRASANRIGDCSDTRRYGCAAAGIHADRRDKHSQAVREGNNAQPCQTGSINLKQPISAAPLMGRRVGVGN